MRHSLRRSLPLRLALAVCSALAALLAAEIGLRVVHERRGTFELTQEARTVRTSSGLRAEEDPELVYGYRPGYVLGGERQTNASGMAQPNDVTRRPEPGTLRVALVGDSLSAGIYLRPEDRLHRRLESALAELIAGRRVEVLNFGVHGYSSLQEARLIETRVLAHEPDLLLLQFCLNDTGISYSPQVWFVDPVEPTVHLWEYAHRKLFGRSDLLARLDVPVVGPHEPGGERWEELYAQGSEGWGRLVEAYARIDRARRTEGVPVLLALFPLLLDDDAPPDALRPYHAQVRALAESHGWPVVDLHDPFVARPAAEVRKAPDDVYHQNGAGNELAARHLAPHVAALLQRSSPVAGGE